MGKALITPSAQLRAVLRSDFMSFARKCFTELNPGVEWKANWHLDAIAFQLTECLAGRQRRLVINIAPRHLKSFMVSVAFVAWSLGHNPSLKFICASYAQELAREHGRQCFKIVTSEWYRKLFQGTRIDDRRRSPESFGTTAGGYRYATSVGGALTGFGADIILVDDPMKPEDATSEAQARTVKNWYDGTLSTRLNDPSTGVIILIMHRLHVDDLTAHVLEKGAWTTLSLPVIAQADMEIPVGPDEVHVYREGELLHPDRLGHEGLKEIKATAGTYNFSAQYLQQPTPLEGSMVRWGWFRFYDGEPARTARDQVIISWDTASKAAELRSYSVGTVWLSRNLGQGREYYLLHVIRSRLEYPDLRREVIATFRHWRPSAVLIEDKASGQSLIQDLRREGLHAIPIIPEGNKVVRFHAQTAVIEAGKVWLPRQAPWLAELQAELLQFPNGKFTDQVDSISQFLNWVERPEENVCWVQDLF